MLKKRNAVIYGLAFTLAAGVVLMIVVRANSNPPVPDYQLDRMHQLTRFEDPDIIENEYRQLLDQGADIDQLDENGSTALYHAVYHDNLTAVHFMLQHGADPNLCADECSPPIVWASRGFKPVNVPIVKALIEAGAEVNVVDPSEGNTPLHLAASTDHLEIAQMLIQAGADVNAVDTQEAGTPLECAVRFGCPRVADLLLSSGADPEHLNKQGLRPIDRINVCPQSEQIRAVFRSHGADDQRRPELSNASAAADE